MRIVEDLENTDTRHIYLSLKDTFRLASVFFNQSRGSMAHMTPYSQTSNSTKSLHSNTSAFSFAPPQNAGSKYPYENSFLATLKENMVNIKNERV
jgi:hypothetical protein